jgi:hypothetical protein
MGTARLVVFYRIDGDERLYCAWKRINIGASAAKEIIKIIKGLPGWENSQLYCIGKGEAYFRKGSRRDGSYKRLSAHYYVGHENETTITREEFCKAVDAIYKDAPVHARQVFKDFGMDPETTDSDIHEIMDFMLDKSVSKKI